MAGELQNRHRLSSAIEHATARADEIDAEIRARRRSNAIAQGEAYRASREPSEPTKPVRLPVSLMNLAARAWPDKKTRISAIQNALLSAIEKAISERVETPSLNVS